MALGISQKLLVKASAQDAVAVTPRAFRHVGCLETLHDVHWDTGVSVGEVTIEGADREDATEWIALAVITFAGTAPKRDVSTRIAGTYGAFRHHITVPLNDGATVTTKIRGAMAVL